MKTTELNKHDTKALETITPFLAKLQEFINVNIIDTKTSGMTAAKVQEKFYQENSDVTVSPSDFIYGFRIAVKTDSITGIEGVKKAGYRMIGFEKSATKEAAPEKINALADVVEFVQATVDKYIVNDTKMTAAMLFEKYSADYGCSLSSEEFVNNFRGLIKDGKITGLKNAYRAGYRRDNGEEEVASSSDNEVPQTKGKHMELMLTDRLKAVAIDSRNWQLQRKGESGKWKKDCYCSTTSNMFSTLANKAFDDEFKHMDSFSIKEFAERLELAEERIATCISDAMLPPTIVTNDVAEDVSVEN